MILVTIACLSLFVWLFLLLFWGGFWRADCRIATESDRTLAEYPTVWVVIPARNEAEAIASSLTSLLNQDYLGKLKIVLVDDNSSDRTAEIAEATAKNCNKPERVKIIAGKPLAEGWKGKLWAMNQGISYAQAQTPAPAYLLFTDADIQHDTDNLRQLVAKAEAENLDLVSLMVLLSCQSFWEKLLIPAFVFFFQKLYPFPWVNDSEKAIAAAAGGCMLIKNEALSKIGGIAAIKDALIDDCSLAHAVKSQGNSIWLGLSETTCSLRGYNNLKAIWDTVARTAYDQLNYSPLLLIGTVIGMTLVYLVAPICLIISLMTGNSLVVGISALTWLLMAIAYLPTLKLYDLSIAWTFALPAIAFLYTLMTLDSAFKHYRGQGGGWKGRTY